MDQSGEGSQDQEEEARRASRGTHVEACSSELSMTKAGREKRKQRR